MNVRLYCLMISIGSTVSTGAFHSMQPGSEGGPMSTSLVQEIPEEHRRILNDISLPLRLRLIKDFMLQPKLTDKQNNGRRENIQSLVLPDGRRRDPEAEAEDNTMKMKLFRLMYETVRDSDTKVKRAELIKKSYSNSSIFEIGYLLGDISDKFNIVTDIRKTLKRLYDEWKPIEHINAYEQISNIAIELAHVADMVKGVEKRAVQENNQNQNQNQNQNPNPPPQQQSNVDSGATGKFFW